MPSRTLAARPKRATASRGLMRRRPHKGDEGSGVASDVLQLQRLFGNRAVSRMIDRQRAGLVQRDEAWEQVKGVGPLDALRAKMAADEAMAAAQNSGLPGLWNGPADAYRHALWHCLMTRAIGAEQAKTVGDTHETLGGNHPNELAMDQHNNAMGILLGRDDKQKDKECSDLVMGALKSGQLLVIPNYDAVAATKGATPPDKPVRSNAVKVP